MAEVQPLQQLLTPPNTLPLRTCLKQFLDTLAELLDEEGAY